MLWSVGSPVHREKREREREGERSTQRIAQGKHFPKTIDRVNQRGCFCEFLQQAELRDWSFKCSKLMWSLAGAAMLLWRRRADSRGGHLGCIGRNISPFLKYILER